jgi:tRNA pseudouridine55 synthase
MPIHLYKPIGLTPLELIKKYKNDNNLSNSKFSFAGRLDPMAHGEMLILKDKERKRQESFCCLDKEYEFEILFGFSTDTYDILGIVNNFNLKNITNKLNIVDYLGEQEQYYPPYSSIVVNKKPLWLWSKDNQLDQIEIPKKKINIYELEYIKDNLDIKNNKELLEIIKKRIYSLSEENYDKFRVNEIIEKWSNVIEKCNDFQHIIKRYRIKCSSGTYVRGLVNRIGEDLGIGACAFEIKRTKILI